MIYTSLLSLVRESVVERETVVVVSEEFFPSPVCDHLGVSSLAFTVLFRCRHTVVAVDPSLIDPSRKVKKLLSCNLLLSISRIPSGTLKILIG